MKSIKTFSLLISIMILFSCGPTVQTFNPQNKDLSKYETFAYLPNSNSNVQDKKYRNEDINSLIVQTVQNNMEQEGYSIDRKKPDLLVLISTKKNQKRGTETDPVYATYPYAAGTTTISPYYNNNYYYGYNNFGSNVVGYDTDTYSYKEGTVVINIIDRETKKTVWKGISSDNIYNQTTQDDMRQMVQEIFDEYPLQQN